MSNYQLASIALYGTPTTGFGWIVQVHGREGLLGTGEPSPIMGKTEAIWEAVAAARAAGLALNSKVEVMIDQKTDRGTVVWVARLNPKDGPRYAGDLSWKAVGVPA